MAVSPASTCSRFDIRENQITLSTVQCYAVALMETECTERVLRYIHGIRSDMLLRWYLVPSLKMYSRWSPQNSSLPPQFKSRPRPPSLLLFRPMLISCRSCLPASLTFLSPPFPLCFTVLFLRSLVRCQGWKGTACLPSYSPKARQ